MCGSCASSTSSDSAYEPSVSDHPLSLTQKAELQRSRVPQQMQDITTSMS